MVKEHSLETVVQDLENELKIKGDHFHFSLAGFDVRGYLVFVGFENHRISFNFGDQSYQCHCVVSAVALIFDDIWFVGFVNHYFEDQR